jgi:hypothetical protein
MNDQWHTPDQISLRQRRNLFSIAAALDAEQPSDAIIPLIIYLTGRIIDACADHAEYSEKVRALLEGLEESGRVAWKHRRDH